MDQRLFLEGYQVLEQIPQVLLDLMPLLRDLFDEPAALRLHKCIEKAEENFLFILRSEEFGESFSAKLDAYHRRAGGLCWEEEMFDPTTSLSRATIERITGAISQELGGEESLILALEFGGLVDRGLRPLDVAASIFIRSPNP